MIRDTDYKPSITVVELIDILRTMPPGYSVVLLDLELGGTLPLYGEDINADSGEVVIG